MTAYTENWLAEAKDEYGTEYVRLYEFRFDWQDYNFHDHRFFVVKHRIMDWDNACYDLFFNDLRSAMVAFGKEANKKCRLGGPKGELQKVYGKVEYCKDWWVYRDEMLPDHNSDYSSKDYGQSNPWDAPGMKISDFLPGVY